MLLPDVIVLGIAVAEIVGAGKGLQPLVPRSTVALTLVLVATLAKPAALPWENGGF